MLRITLHAIDFHGANLPGNGSFLKTSFTLFAELSHASTQLGSEKSICVSTNKDNGVLYKDHTSPFSPISLWNRSASAFPSLLLQYSGGEREGDDEVLFVLRSVTGPMNTGAVSLDMLRKSPSVLVELKGQEKSRRGGTVVAKVTATTIQRFPGVVYRGQLSVEIQEAMGDLRMSRGGSEEDDIYLRNGQAVVVTVSLGMIGRMQLRQYGGDGKLLGFAKLGRIFTEENLTSIVNKKVKLVDWNGRRVSEYFVKLRFFPSGAASVIQRRFRQFQGSLKRVVDDEQHSDDEYKDDHFEPHDEPKQSKYISPNRDAYGLAIGSSRSERDVTALRKARKCCRAVKPPKLTERGGKRQTGHSKHGTTKQTSSGNQEAFLLRLDQQVNASRRRTEYKAGKQEYDAKVSKRACPQCGRFQSYDEVMKKKKHCTDCRRTYVYPVLWKDVREEFIRRNVDASPRIHDTYHHQCKGAKRVKSKVSWKTVRRDFLARMEKPSTSKGFKGVTPQESQESQESQDRTERKATSARKKAGRRNDGNRMNYSMYVEGCTANSLPAHVERVLGKDAALDVTNNHLDMDISEEESPEWIHARDLVLSRLRKNQRCTS